MSVQSLFKGPLPWGMGRFRQNIRLGRVRACRCFAARRMSDSSGGTTVVKSQSYTSRNENMKLFGYRLEKRGELIKETSIFILLTKEYLMLYIRCSLLLTHIYTINVRVNEREVNDVGYALILVSRCLDDT